MDDRIASTALISPAPSVGAGRHELPAYLSNGVIGLRVREVPLTSGIAILSGYAGEHPVERIEAAARVPYPLEGKIRVNDVQLSDAASQVRDLEQRYDFATGELTSTFRFPTEGVDLRASVVTFCCRSDPTLVCQQMDVVCDASCDLVLSAGIDSRAIEGHGGHIQKEVDGAEGLIRWVSCGKISTCGLAYGTSLEGADDATRSVAERNDQLSTHYAFRAEAGRRYRLNLTTSVVPGIMHRQPELQAARLVALGCETGFDALRAKNAEIWQDIWRGRIRLIGADRRWQELADAAFFYLNTSVHPSSPASTSIFGLSTWKDYHYYYGHVMWDIESFALPVVALVQPEAAAAILEYRFDNVEPARMNAKMVGRRGLQFPWHSATSSGHEAAPLPGTATWYEDHVTLDVASAFVLYWRLSRDEVFLRDKAWPVLKGVADWIVSRVKKTDRGYEILRSMGIAERKEPCDNPAFTNMSAKAVLRSVLEIGETLGVSADPKWRAIERDLVLPERDGTIVSHDGYTETEEKGATPDPLMGIFPLWFPLSSEQQQATLRFYLDQADDYIGSPMLSALYGVWATWAGDRELAAVLLEQGYAGFTADRFSQTLEYRPDRFPEQPEAGPFFANMNGFLLSLLFGFPGIRPSGEEPEAWPARAVVLPAGWEAIEVDRLWIGGREARLVARQGAERAVLEFEESTEPGTISGGPRCAGTRLSSVSSPASASSFRHGDQR
jgi:trehalose/maltose hydrolase-like predicted phosphorylase